MQHAKRIVSMVLALLMVLGTVGWIFSMVASAEGIKGRVIIDEVRNGTTSIYKRDTHDKVPPIKRGYDIDCTVRVTFNFPTREEATVFQQGTVNTSWNDGSFQKGSIEDTMTLESTSGPEEVNGGDGGYNLIYTVKVSGATYTGKGDTLDIIISNKDANYYEYLSPTVKECDPDPVRTPSSDSDDDDDDNSKFIDAPTPYVIVSGFDYGSGQISAGDTFTLNLTIKNTSLNLDVTNMVMTVTPSESFTLVNTSNTVYISRLDAKESIEKSMKMQAKPSADPAAATVEIKLSYQYVDETRKTVDRSESISIPIVQQERFSVSPPEDVATEIYVGEEADLSLDYMNKGRGTIYNVSASIRGENLKTPGQTDNVGNVESGKSGTFDFYVAGIEPGVVSGEVVVTYEDVNMNVKTISVPFSINVNSMEMETGGDMMGYVDENGNTVMPDGTVLGPDGMPIDPNAAQGNSMLLFIGIGAGVLVAIIIVIVVAKKKRKARLEAELAEDDDEDN